MVTGDDARMRFTGRLLRSGIRSSGQGGSLASALTGQRDPLLSSDLKDGNSGKPKSPFDKSQPQDTSELASEVEDSGAGIPEVAGADGGPPETISTKYVSLHDDSYLNLNDRQLNRTAEASNEKHETADGPAGDFRVLNQDEQAPEGSKVIPAHIVDSESAANIPADATVERSGSAAHVTYTDGKEAIFIFANTLHEEYSVHLNLNWHPERLTTHLSNVLSHEIGHAAGLKYDGEYPNHNTDINSIMYHEEHEDSYTHSYGFLPSDARYP